MSFVGDSVLHVTLGVGIIKNIDDNYIYIRFANQELQFQFPFAFLRENPFCIRKVIN